MMDAILHFVGTALVWLMLIVALLVWPFSAFARGMATVPGNVPPCRACAVISAIALVLIILLLRDAWS